MDQVKYPIAIFRHSQAQTTDDEMGRALTPEGEQRAKNAGLKMDVQWESVLCSPAVRAQQTAFLISGINHTVVDSLYVNGEPKAEVLDELASLIQEKAKLGPVLVVTHAPMMDPLIRKTLSPEESTFFDFASGEGVLYVDGTIQRVSL